MKWYGIGSGQWTGRDLPRVFRHDGWMYLSNGWRSGEPNTRDLWFANKPDRWTRINAATPYEAFAPIVSFKGNLVAALTEQWVSSNGGAAFTQIANPPWSGYGELVVVSEDCLAWVGNDGIWTTNSPAGTWQHVASNPPWQGTWGQLLDPVNVSVMMFDSKIVMLGGREDVANVPPETGWPYIKTWTRSVHVIDPTDWSIEALDLEPPFWPSWWFSSTIHMGSLYVSSGMANHFRTPGVEADGNLTDMFRCDSLADLLRNKWERIDDTGFDWIPSARHAAAMVSDRGKLYLMGGSKNSGPSSQVQTNDILAFY